jgi:hypothetical protein
MSQTWIKHFTVIKQDVMERTKNLPSLKRETKPGFYCVWTELIFISHWNGRIMVNFWSNIERTTLGRNFDVTFGRAAFEACSTTWDLAFALRQRKTTNYLSFAINWVFDLHKPHRKHQRPTVLLLLHAHSFPQERVYRAVASSGWTTPTFRR